MPRWPKSTDPPEPFLVDPEDETAALAELGDLAAQLKAAARESEQERNLYDDVVSRIALLSKEAQQRLFTYKPVRALFEAAADAETPASPAMPPGTIIYRKLGGDEPSAWSKKPWSWRDLLDPPPPRTPMPTATWTPERRQTLIWNGLAVTVFSRRPVTLPEVFHGVYMEGLRAEELAEQHAAWLMKKRDTLADPGMVTPGGAMSRAISNHDGKQNVHSPGGGAEGVLQRSPTDIDFEAGA